MESESERLRTEANAYVDALIARMRDPGLAEATLIADRPFMVSCMVGFACQHLADTLKKLGAARC